MWVFLDESLDITMEFPYFIEYMLNSPSIFIDIGIYIYNHTYDIIRSIIYIILYLLHASCPPLLSNDRPPSCEYFLPRTTHF